MGGVGPDGRVAAWFFRGVHAARGAWVGLRSFSDFARRAEEADAKRRPRVSTVEWEVGETAAARWCAAPAESIRAAPPVVPVTRSLFPIAASQQHHPDAIAVV